MSDPALILDDLEGYAGMVSSALEGADLSVDDRVMFLCAIRDLRTDLSVLAADIEARLVSTADKKRWIVEDYGEVQIRRSMKRTQWDDDGLARVVIARALDERVLNEETGEYEPGHEAVARVLLECERPSWRVTPLRDRGIAPDEFCHEEPDHLSIQLPPRRSGA